MKIIGIAGESGTGKSTVSDHLASRGGFHIDADRVGHELLDSDEGVVAAVRERIGADVFDARGRIDRRALGRKVFSRPELLATLNRIIHPAIRRECGRRVHEMVGRGVPFVVIDAALLLDSEMPFEFDLMIALRCDPEEQMRRIMAKGGRDESEVRARLANQRHIEKSFYKADVIVDTDKALDAVLAEVDRLVDDLLRTA